MSRIAGIEIGATLVRVVIRKGRANPLTIELPFTLERIDATVAELAAAAGTVSSISIAIGLAHLYVKQVKLPPVAHAARRQMLTVEPERWFALAPGTATAIALDTSGDIALGADGGFVDACVEAFAAWAPVQRVEAAPMALARALRTAGHRSAVASLDAGADEGGLIEVEAGVLRTVRRARAADLAASSPMSVLTAGIDARYGVALGATYDIDGVIDTMLLTPTLEHRFRRAQYRQIATWIAAASIAIGTAAWSAGVARDRQLAALETEITTARAKASAGTSLMTRAMSIDRELAAISTTSSSRPDALAMLAALGTRLPEEAVAQRVRVVGTDWQIEGNTTKAAAVLAALAAEPRFENVRFLAPSNRFRDGTEDRETFAIAFAVR